MVRFEMDQAVFSLRNNWPGRLLPRPNSVVFGYRVANQFQPRPLRY
jgi:hypothetical protein